MDQLKEAGLVTGLQQGAIQRVFDRARLLPGEIVFLGRLNGAVAHALCVIPRHDDLQGGEEGLDEDFRLIVEVLADALRHRNG